jgi:tetratricopeptide (TPR) repeat protein
MKRIFLILSLALLLVGCSTDQSHNWRLLTAERLMDERPNQVLAMLNPDSAQRLSSAADTALYNLLYTEAILKNGLWLNNTSLINRSIAHYTATGDHRHLAQSYLYRSMNALKSNHYGEAMSDALRAFPMVEKLDSRRLDYEMNDVLGRINSEVGCHRLALPYFRQALQAATALPGDTLAQVLSLNYLAQTYEQLGQYANFTRAMVRCQRLLKHVNLAQQANVKTTLGEYYIRIHQTARGQRLLEETSIADLSRRASLMLGNLYARQGNRTKAVDLWYDAVMSSMPAIRMEAITKLINDARLHNNPEDVFSLLIIRDETIRDAPNAGTANDIAAQQNNYWKQLEERQQYRRFITLLCVIIGLLVALLIFIGYHRRRIRLFRTKISDLNGRYLADLEAYHTATGEVERLKKRIADYQEDRQQPDEWNIKETLLTHAHIFHLHRLAARSDTAKPEDWDRLRQLITEYDGHFLPALNACGNINARELAICMLIRLRFIPSEIALLTGLSSQQVTNVRTRLQQRLFGQKGSTRDFDTRIRQLT